VGYEAFVRPDGAPGGRQKWREVYAGSQRECRRKLDELRREVERGRAPVVTDRRRLIVGDLLAEWLRDCELRGRRPKTLWGYRQLCRLYVAPALGRVRVVDLRAAHVRQALQALTARGLSPTTVRHARNAAHAALALAVRDGLLADNPAAQVKAPAARRPALRWPSPDELGVLLDTARAAGDRLAALWTVAALAGCRPGELLGLGWGDVDWEAGRITVRRNLVKVPGRAPVLAAPKTEKGRRALRLAPEAMEALRLHRTRQAALKLRLGGDYGGAWREADLVFATLTGTPLLPRNVDRAFKRALARAGLPETMRFYDLRHGNATLMLKAGVAPKVAAERLGHATTALFQDTYAHMLGELDQDAAEKIGAGLRRATARA
jgi:integrase